MAANKNLLKLKAKCSNIIGAKLREFPSTCICYLLTVHTGEAAAPLVIPRMNYVSFEEAMTNKYGIVLRRWPLNYFVCPGQISSVADLEVLYEAFKNDVTTFYKMTPAELDEWRAERARKRLAAQQAADSTTPDAGTSSSPPSTSSRAATPSAATPSSTPSAATSSSTPSTSAAAVEPSATPSASSPVANVSRATETSGPGVGPQVDAPLTQIIGASSPDAGFAVGDKRPIEAVFVLTGEHLVGTKPKRVRSDKGKKRGPNKKTRLRLEAEAAAAAAAAAQAAS